MSLPQASEAMSQRQHQAEAEAFIESLELELFCDWLEWDAGAIRCAAAEGMAPRYKQWA